ncbi:MAG: hypothetical protein ABIQ52_02770 [Vicinamibacterales bacterium]
MSAEVPIEPIRRKVVWGMRGRLTLALIGILSLTSCSQVIRTGQSPSYLIVASLQGAPGVTGAFGASLQSDVLNVNPTTGATSIASDRGQATLQLASKDPLGAAPTDVNSITITQYHVDYIRTDGRNVQGVDVPFAFDGAVTVTVSGAATPVPFTLVRVQAKQEAPLSAMAFSGGANTITTIARVTFYGRDQNGREVSVMGNIEVTFSDWAG